MVAQADCSTSGLRNRNRLLGAGAFEQASDFEENAQKAL